MNADAEALIRLLDDEDWENWKPCPKCGLKFPNFSAFLSHLKKDHDFK